jgi:16S rRNA (guanine966-N2)-methyltransferase
MKLRIISGTLSRRYITIDKNSQRFRPTQERVRQAVAETLKPRIPGSAAADVCAGSGAMGLELVSRGASHVDFIDDDRMRCQSIARHCEAFGIAAQCTVITRNVRSFCDDSGASYDIIFYDPPYEDAVLAALVPDLCNLLNPSGVLAYERDKSGIPQGEKLPMTLYKVEVRNYGDTAVEYIMRIV